MRNLIVTVLLLFSLPVIAESRPSKEQQKETAKRAQRGITIFAGSHFQSCAPLRNPDEDPVKTMQDFFGYDESYTNESSCVDRRDADFRYISFTIGSSSTTAGHLKTRNGKLDAFNRFNCSGFVAGTLSAAGLKYYPGQQSISFSPTTHEMRDNFWRGDSCFFSPWISKGMSLLPGDVINVSSGHVVRVLTVGEDPLNLKSVKTRDDCRKIQKWNFDFTIAHSSSEGKGANYSGVKIETAKETGTNIISRLAEFTRKMCYDTFDSGLGGKVKDVKIGIKKIGSGLFSIKRGKYFQLRRHYGMARPECVRTRPKVRGRDCLQNRCVWKVRSDSH